MESGGHSANPSDRPSHRLADIVGTVIALMTLTLPIYVIAHYSSTRVEPIQNRSYTLPGPRD